MLVESLTKQLHMNITDKDINRFWTKVSIDFSNPTGCWIWTGTINIWGYGSIYIDGKTRGAHRISYQIANGSFDYNFHVCHTCDNPACVNPDHLWLGTAKDNAIDRVLKGRDALNKAKGSKCGKSKLTEEQVLEIRKLHSLEMYTTQKQLATQFGISLATFKQIITRKTWKHI